MKKSTLGKSLQLTDQRQVLHLARGLLNTLTDTTIYLFIIYVH